MNTYLNLLFSYHNKINRKTYLKGKICQIILIFPSIFFIFLAPDFFLKFLHMQSNIGHLVIAISYLVGLILAIPIIIAKFALDIKRLRDIGLSAWWVITDPSFFVISKFHHFPNVFLSIVGLSIMLAYFLIPTNFISKVKLTLSRYKKQK